MNRRYEMKLYTETKVTIFFNGDDGEGSTWHCGSLEGAKRFVEQKVAKGNVYAYSIEVIDWIPIDENDQDGQLYGGMRYMDYQEVK